MTPAPPYAAILFGPRSEAVWCTSLGACTDALMSCWLKVVDLQNLHSLVITLGAYLGPDSCEMLKIGFLDM